MDRERPDRCPTLFVLLLVVAASQPIWFLKAPPAQAETRFTPSAYFWERYDSNVWYGPKSIIPPGAKPWDFVTTFGAGAQVENTSRMGNSALSAGIYYNVLANNPELNFLNTNVLATSDLSGWTEELLRGLRLRISDTFWYTPEPAAFLAPQASDAFTRGIQVARANSYKNILRTESDYALTRSVDLGAAYSYSLFRQGNVSSGTTTALVTRFFDTTLHTARASPAYRFEGGDQLFLLYTYNTAESVPVSGVGRQLRYTAHSIEPEYVSTFFRDWTLRASGGATIVEQAGNRTFFSGGLSLVTNVERTFRVQGAVSRRVAPAFFGTGGAMISNLVQLNVIQRLSPTIQLTGNVGYAYNESTPVKTFKYDSILASVVLDYQLTRTYKVALSQEYNRFSYTGVETFDRFATMFTVTAEWK